MTSGEAAGPLGDVSRETIQRLHKLEALARKWTARINLVSRNSADEIWTRHIVDSAQLFEFAPKAAASWLDLGSGGGFPGLVIAILAAERKPDLRVTLVESDLRKSAFLNTAIRELSLTASVLSERAEVLAPQAADTISARALAPLPRLLEFAKRHLKTGGTAIFPKGETWELELKDALESWRFSVQKHRSTTEPGSVILTIGDIARV